MSWDEISSLYGTGWLFRTELATDLRLTPRSLICVAPRKRLGRTPDPRLGRRWPIDLAAQSHARYNLGPEPSTRGHLIPLVFRVGT
jgi:hypothetical protein